MMVEIGFSFNLNYHHKTNSRQGKVERDLHYIGGGGGAYNNREGGLYYISIFTCIHHHLLIYFELTTTTPAPTSPVAKALPRYRRSDGCKVCSSLTFLSTSIKFTVAYVVYIALMIIHVFSSLGSNHGESKEPLMKLLWSRINLL